MEQRTLFDFGRPRQARQERVGFGLMRVRREAEAVHSSLARSGNDGGLRWLCASLKPPESTARDAQLRRYEYVVSMRFDPPYLASSRERQIRERTRVVGRADTRRAPRSSAQKKPHDRPTDKHATPCHSLTHCFCSLRFDVSCHT